jgi:hypothetical protein
VQENTPEQNIAGFERLLDALENGRRILLAPTVPDAEKLTLMGFHAVAIRAHVNGSVDPQITEPFKGADVLVVIDEVEEKYHEQKKLGIAIKAVARSVKYLDLQNYAEDARSGFTVAEWIDDNKATADELGKLIDEATGDAPERSDIGVHYESKFGLVRWEDQYSQKNKNYIWQVAGLIPAGKVVLWYGASQTGKSFSAFDCGLHIAQGLPYQGRRTLKGGVVYCFVEKGSGAVHRMQAFQRYHGYPAKDIPFAVLTKRFDIFSNEKVVREIAAEALAIAKNWKVPLAAIVIDTNDKATSGADEISKKDVSTVVKRYELLAELTGAGVWPIAHTNGFGQLRGNKILYNEVETVIEIAETGDNNHAARRDDEDRIIRTAVVKKQSEGKAGVRWEFVLGVVEVAKNEFDEPVTSCVVLPPNGAASEPMKALPKNALALFKALLLALGEHGQLAPAGVHAPKTLRVVDRKVWKTKYDEKAALDEPDPEKRAARVSKAMERFVEKFSPLGFIGIHNIGKDQWVWWTGKPVPGIPETRLGASAPPEMSSDDTSFS